ncbi:UDP-2-acetamido-2,6-beta-L-arabino-hexul-4-ose reductase [Thermomonas haemolytica]|uniref:UDP-2-acetamido-2,6-beta-L-arabino-hexul-4-ose reductase n=1 Tax=Thermomonas haemolytica TaxID=141949 RepID=A0A4R3N0B6_9GAMM|nr:NAD-dependent epimerase/dehydratase family protein [Thermomonas haemolytica]TCT22460.1 UDP-2-acetamido-2,6-beta-L-arabino-hexul-4-ose reductase [Thermomonas haemolytica]TNY29286.1 capsular biosynthesis protein [Thermomonas haemolytica]
MKVLVTGADGFIGQNLRVALGEREGFEVLPITRASSAHDLRVSAAEADAVIHLAGVNRPQDPAEFFAGNADFTATLCDALASAGRAIPVAFASSIQAQRDNPYGMSKRQAEAHLAAYGERTGAPVALYRLANVFGKWSRPNYNSAVATFCHNIARGLPVRIDNPDALVQLVYVDDVVAEFLQFLAEPGRGVRQAEAGPVHAITVGDLARQIEAFKNVRSTLVTERVGTGLVRALYATYVSFLPPQAFSYSVPKYADARGVFVEMLKTPDCGQFSFFTAHPGVTRGGHYHHTKTEKFLVIKGRARYRFRHLLTNETFEVVSHGDEPLVVETIPGWAHDITNIGEDDLVVMLWANEIFDRQKPDTVASRV